MFKDSSTVPFKQVHEKEIVRIKTRRRELNEKEGRPGNDTGDPRKDAVGLAFSGGGIRSATFSLGLLQALARYDVLKRVDYLSTVSGGGYVGSCLTWFMSVLKQDFPFGTRRRDNTGKAGDVVAWLRARGNYLTPGEGLNLWALIGAVLAGTLSNLAVLVPVFLLLVNLLAQSPPLYHAESWMRGGGLLLALSLLGLVWIDRNRARAHTRTVKTVRVLGVLGVMALTFGAGQLVHALLQQKLSDPSVHNGFGLLLSSGMAALALFLLLALLYAVATRVMVFCSVPVQRAVQVAAGSLLMFGVFFVAAGTIPLVHGVLEQHLAEWLRTFMSVVTLSGALSVIGALRGRKQGSESHGLRAFFLSVGLALIIYGLFLWFYHLVGNEPNVPTWLRRTLIVSAALGLLANINHVSMHRFYRNRLMEAYMPDDATEIRADKCYLHKIPQTSAPYHLINTNIQLTGSDEPKYHARAGDNFVFSPEFCGASSTGFANTESYLGRTMNLATAFAISGAAVDPNTYFTRSKPLTFLMTLFNARLGYWARNPRHATWFGYFVRPPWYWYIFREMFSNGLDENGWNIHLSDGGHFENLGLYELVRRRCRVIIVSDAGADPHATFSDLARVIELVRVDFGAKVSLNVELLKPRGADRLSPRAFVEGTIAYTRENADDDGPETAQLIYIKTAMLEDLPEDVNGYRREHEMFPNETTADQFFDEAQFEAYRELGYQIGSRLCAKYGPEKLDSLRSNQS